ncbi:MAG: cell wall-binding repeat-containing protein [Actinobacteria bacterium]|nr:cell wall-binding repeat-containing protein [Actinomycetota bacterium]
MPDRTGLPGRTSKTLLGNTNVERIKGDDRYKTADAVAARVIEVKGGAFDGTAFVATGANFPDALAAAPLAAVPRASHERHHRRYAGSDGRRDRRARARRHSCGIDIEDREAERYRHET